MEYQEGEKSELMNLQDMGDLAKKVDKLEKDFAKADYILSEVMTALAMFPAYCIGEEHQEWAVRNYAEYLKEKGGD